MNRTAAPGTDPTFTPDTAPPPEVFISDDDSQAGRKPMIVVDPSHKPSEFGRQFVMFSNVLFSSATIAMLRTLANRNKNNTPPVNAENLPKWYLDEYSRKASFKKFGAAYLRDTALLTAASYVMDGVAVMLDTLRGTEDAFNKTMGGLAAGSMVAYFWFPGRLHAQTIMGSTGALVGWLAFTMRENTKALLLEQQKKLEEEIGVPNVERRPILDPDYLRELMRVRQRQIVDIMQQQQHTPGTGAGQPGAPLYPSTIPNGMPGMPGSTALPGASPYGPTPGTAPYGTAPGTAPYGTAPGTAPYGTAPGATPYGTAPGSAPGGGAQGPWGQIPPSSDGSRQYSTIQDDSAAYMSRPEAPPSWAPADNGTINTAADRGGMDRPQAGGEAQGGHKRQGWGWFGRRGGQQPGGGKDAGLAPGMEIREEPDVWDDTLKENIYGERDRR